MELVKAETSGIGLLKTHGVDEAVNIKLGCVTALVDVKLIPLIEVECGFARAWLINSGSTVSFGTNIRSHNGVA